MVLPTWILHPEQSASSIVEVAAMVIVDALLLEADALTVLLLGLKVVELDNTVVVVVVVVVDVVDVVDEVVLGDIILPTAETRSDEDIAEDIVEELAVVLVVLLPL